MSLDNDENLTLLAKLQSISDPNVAGMMNRYVIADVCAQAFKALSELNHKDKKKKNTYNLDRVRNDLLPPDYQD